MVLYCFLCKSTYNKEENDVRMHRVPRKERILKLWKSVLNIEQINRNARFCSKHFTEEDFVISVVGEKKYLKPDAIPSRNLPDKVPSKNLPDTVPSMNLPDAVPSMNLPDAIPSMNLPDAALSMNLQKDEKNTDCSSSKKKNIQNTQHRNMEHTSLKRSLSMEQSVEEVPLKNIRTIKDIDIKKVSQSPLEAGACLEVLIEELQEKQKEVKNLKNKVRKLDKTVKELRSLLKILKDNKLITNRARDTVIKNVKQYNGCVHQRKQVCNRDP